MDKIFLTFLFSLLIAACSPLDALNFNVSNEGVAPPQTDIAYAQGPRHTLDIYKPLHPAAGHPVLVFFYGGAWQEGSKNDYKFVAEPLAARGITVIVPDYRVYPDVTFPDFLKDGAQAIAWTKTHMDELGGDPHHLFIMGHSSGAYITAMLALNPAYLKTEGLSPSELAGAIGIAGPYDFLPITRSDIKPIFEVVPDLTITQPITFADGQNPPLLLLAGKDDTTVEPRNTVALDQRILSYNGTVDMRLYPDVAHVGIILAFTPLFHDKAPVLDDVVSFIASHESHPP